MNNDISRSPKYPIAALALRRVRGVLSNLATLAALTVLAAVTGFGPATAQPVIAQPDLGALPAPPKRLGPLPAPTGTGFNREILASKGRLRGLYPWDCQGAACGTVPQPNSLIGKLPLAMGPRFSRCMQQCSTHSNPLACAYACGNAAGLSDGQIEGTSYVAPQP